MVHGVGVGALRGSLGHEEEGAKGMPTGGTGRSCQPGKELAEAQRRCGKEQNHGN